MPGDLLDALSLASIVVNLAMISGYWDVMMRDLALVLLATAFARLAGAFPAGAVTDRLVRTGAVPATPEPNPDLGRRRHAAFVSTQTPTERRTSDDATSSGSLVGWVLVHRVEPSRQPRTDWRCRRPACRQRFTLAAGPRAPRPR